jgi:hypothetical protein
MYRPTVRYDNRYRDYVQKLYHATTLDRNQIFRLGMFLLGHSKEGKAFLSSHLKKGSSLPSPDWTLSDYGLVMDSWLETLEGEKDVLSVLEGGTSLGHVENMERQTREIPHSPRQVHDRSEYDRATLRTARGGIKITIK